ncbi:Transporter, partial [Pseudomonas coronafaciens pv. garcae]
MDSVAGQGVASRLAGTSACNCCRELTMTSIWRTSVWILVGSALILALSLGTRHGFGLFLSPMSADFGWGRAVFAFAIALQNL